MKTITLHQPWATLVALGEKKNETRSWPTNHRGFLAIHAGKSIPPYAKDFMQDEEWFSFIAGYAPGNIFLPLGQIICVVNLVDCVPTTSIKVSKNERRWGDYSEGRFAWVFDGVRILNIPITISGHQGIWNAPVL